MSEAALIWCPFADEDSAAQAAAVLLDEGLVACANLMPGMRSLYRWNGEAGDACECGVLIKTRADLLELASARLAEVHPYDEPAITGWIAGTASPGTLDWLAGLGAPSRTVEGS